MQSDTSDYESDKGKASAYPWNWAILVNQSATKRALSDSSAKSREQDDMKRKESV